MKSIVFLSNDQAEIDKISGIAETNRLDIKTFSNPTDFLKHIISAPPALLIIDNDLPGANIPEFIQKLKSNTTFSDIPILVIASPASRAEVASLIKLGLKDFLIKPYLNKILLQKLKNTINLDEVAAGRSSVPGASAKGTLNVIAEEKRKKQIMNELDNLPAFPVIVQKVIQIVGDRTSSASDFEKYVSKDQSLTAKMLKMSNSPFYGAKREIILIRDAVVTLGYKTVKTIAFAAGTGSIFKKNLPQYGLAPGGLWKHSFGVALASRMVARALGFDDDASEEMFICGLLHDVGKLILGNFIQKEDKVYNPSDGSRNICIEEKKITGFSHSELGELIAQKWDLPEKICYTVKFHHNSDEAMEYGNEVAIVALADYICKSLRIGCSKKNDHEPTLGDTVKLQLSLTDEQLLSFTSSMQENLKELDKIAGF